MWFTSYMYAALDIKLSEPHMRWGVIFSRSQRMPLYDWKKIRFATWLLLALWIGST